MAIFNGSWEPMLELLKSARSFEFLIRIASELKSNEEFIKARTWKKFKEAENKIEREEIDNHIDELWREDARKMKLIKQLADKLAHADYLGARNRINTYSTEFKIQSKTFDSPVKIMSVDRVMHDDGTIAEIKYELESNKQNTTLEEFMVFEKQGYVKAAFEILENGKNEIEKLYPKIGLKCSALVMSRGLKFGTKKSSI